MTDDKIRIIKKGNSYSCGYYYTKEGRSCWMGYSVRKYGKDIAKKISKKIL